MDKDVSGALRRLLLLAMLGLPLVAAAAVEPQRLVDAARAQVGVTLGYDPAYRQLDYPGGDVPLQTGVCTDVVVRALRGTRRGCSNWWTVIRRTCWSPPSAARAT